jgi:tRNA dimethylallyltransferase
VELDEALAETRRLTRQFVRRQANWFKSDDPSIRWFMNDGGAEEEIERCISTWVATEPTGA